MPAMTHYIDRLAALRRWTYRASRRSSSEPAAWTAIALAAHGRVDAAFEPAAWLAELQQADGSVGVSPTEAEPPWPTALAILAWRLVDSRSRTASFGDHVARGVHWALANRGLSAPQSPHVGHDTTIPGWSWAQGTHAWLEPTCLFVMALNAAGFQNHQRTREGVRLVHDRLLPEGGANYGNTIVLGQALLPHVQPTGLAMMALAGAHDADGRIVKSLDYLERAIESPPAAASLSFACLGLAAHGRRPAVADAALADSLAAKHPPHAAQELALLALAAKDDAAWLPQGESASPHAATRLKDAS